MERIAVFPGSFDPITLGHFSLIERALPLFDKIIVAIGVNSTKEYLFPLEQRLAWLHRVFEPYPKIVIDHFVGLTAHYCIQKSAGYLLRGLRNSADFEYEKTVSQVNNILSNGVETLFLISTPDLSHISSSIVRELIKGKGEVSSFLPKGIDVYKTFSM